MKQDGGMRVVEFVFTYACVAQLAGALGSYPSGWRFNPARRYHKQKLDFWKNFCYNIYVEKIQKEKIIYRDGGAMVAH